MENVNTNSLNAQKELNVHTDTVKEEDTMTTEKLKNYLENITCGYKCKVIHI